jgi:hypothetical protein
VVFDWKSEAFSGYRPVREPWNTKIVNVHWPSGPSVIFAEWSIVGAYSAQLTNAEGAPPADFCSPISGPFLSNLHAAIWSPGVISWAISARTTNGLVVSDPSLPPVLSFDEDLIVWVSVQVQPGSTGNPSQFTPTMHGAMGFWYYNKIANSDCYGTLGDPGFGMPHATVVGAPYILTLVGPFFPFSVTVPSTASYNDQVVTFIAGSLGWGGGGFGPSFSFGSGPVSVVNVRAAYRLGPPP